MSWYSLVNRLDTRLAALDPEYLTGDKSGEGRVASKIKRLRQGMLGVGCIMREDMPCNRGVKGRDSVVSSQTSVIFK